MTVLSLIVADQLTLLKKEVDTLIDKGTEKKLAIVNVLRKYTKESKAVRFEGDNYSEEWAKEAKKRKLSNIKSTPEALVAYETKQTKALFAKYGVLGEREMDARQEIKYENYVMKIQIESRVIADLAKNHIIPTTSKYQNVLIANAKGLKELKIDNSEVKKTIVEISKHMKVVSTEVEKMTEDRKKANKIDNMAKRAAYYCDIKDKYFDNIRYAVDKLENLVDDEDWPLVKYREMLFLR